MFAGFRIVSHIPLFYHFLCAILMHISPHTSMYIRSVDNNKNWAWWHISLELHVSMSINVETTGVCERCEILYSVWCLLKYVSLSQGAESHWIPSYLSARRLVTYCLRELFTINEIDGINWKWYLILEAPTRFVNINGGELMPFA